MAKNHTDQNTYFLRDWLKAIRLECGFTQNAIAEILNVNRSTYTYYENGKTMPDPITLHRIARIFDVPIETFFAEEPPAASLEDPNGKKRRAPKKVQRDPEKIGQLSAKEKEIVAYLRDRQIPADKVLEALKARFGVDFPTPAIKPGVPSKK